MERDEQCTKHELPRCPVCRAKGVWRRTIPQHGAGDTASRLRAWHDYTRLREEYEEEKG